MYRQESRRQSNCKNLSGTTAKLLVLGKKCLFLESRTNQGGIMEKSFLATLFGGFETFISVKVITVVYIIGMVFISFSALFGLYNFLSNGQIVQLLLVLPAAFVALMIWRVICEASVALIKIAENTSR
jgi:hypothetical protein